MVNPHGTIHGNLHLIGMTIQSGTCHCGCGEKTRLASRNDKRDGSIKGQPVRYIHGHHRRKSPVEYKAEDRGYKTPCWVWQKAIGTGKSHGYGSIYDDGRMRPAHIVYYQRKYGEAPKGKMLDHLCRVRCCVNPDHLEPVTDAENVQRGINAVLTPREVLEIRQIGNGMKKSSLAERFGISVSNIKMILAGKTWKNVAQAS